MSSINTLEGLDKVAATVALRNLKKHAEDALQLIFASGCMVSPVNLTVIDPYSYNHASKYFLHGPMKKYLRALRMTKTKTIELMHHMEALSGDGDPNRGKLTLWTHYQSSPAHPNYTEGLMSPVAILNKDFAYVEACLELINERKQRENNPSLHLSHSHAGPHQW